LLRQDARRLSPESKAVRDTSLGSELFLQTQALHALQENRDLCVYKNTVVIPKNRLDHESLIMFKSSASQILELISKESAFSFV